jgi:hypothetical protein
MDIFGQFTGKTAFRLVLGNKLLRARLVNAPRLPLLRSFGNRGALPCEQNKSPIFDGTVVLVTLLCENWNEIVGEIIRWRALLTYNFSL